MGSKRKFSEFKAEQSGQTEKGGTRERIPGYHAPKNPKKKNGKKSRVKPGSMNWVKKRARTIERRFKTGQNMPANIQNDLERELAHHQQKITEAADEKRRKTMIKKYHMVRFFERKKADRLAKQIKSQIETAKDDKEIDKLKADLHRAEIDSIYTRFFPYRERYISLYPVASLGLSVHGGEKAEDASSAAQALHTERPPLWEEIETASEKGIPALIEIRERKLGTGSRGKHPRDDGPSKDSAPATVNRANTKNSNASDGASSRQGKGKSRIKRDKPSEPIDGSDSEGGFFEED
ncbi:rRNA-processing protein efg1 [Parahypoxylon ruwenzoriense]